jgi:arginyl-tRNA--protein-N-Asp/Glu arginylyltransferase
MNQSSSIFPISPLRLRVTRPQPCAYLAGQHEQRLAGDISAKPEEHDSLAEAGFRRVENWVYKPACTQCQACQPIRVMAEEFVLSRNHKRVISANADLTRKVLSGPVTLEHYDIFQRYLASRHEDGQMASMSFDEFSAMIVNSPIDTCLYEYSDKKGRLISCALVDQQRDGLSAVYSFFDTSDESQTRSLGTFMILDLIRLAQAHNLPYLYLGYYVEQSRKMAYKMRFSPCQILKNGQWETVSS